MESQPQNPEFRINSEYFHPCKNDRNQGTEKNIENIGNQASLCTCYCNVMSAWKKCSFVEVYCWIYSRKSQFTVSLKHRLKT